MTANQVEQVTPRIRATHPHKSPRTWRQPKIRLHSAPQSTPNSVSQPIESNNFRATRVRVTAPSLLETTPVTNPTTPKPLRFRIAGTELQPDNICRQLFPTTRPSKRPRNAAPSFRFSCGRERTQPSSDSNRGHFSDALHASSAQAHRNSRIFRNAVTTTSEDTNLEAFMGEGLLFELSGRRSEYLLLRSTDNSCANHSIEVALVINDELLSKLVAEDSLRGFSQSLIYIPFPWYAQLVDKFTVCCSRILITGYTVDVYRKEDILSHADLTKLTWLRMNSFTEAGSNLQHPNIDPLQTSGFYFTSVSPHSSVTDLSVYVDVYEPDRNIAIIRDDAGEFAVLVTNDAEIRPRSSKYDLSNVSVLPYQILPHVMFEVAAKSNSEQFQQRLERSRNKKACWVFQCDRDPN